MLNTESVNTEFSRAFSDNIKKTAVAFANTSGGAIYIGVENNGIVVGVDDPDSVSRQAADSIRKSVKPDITRFTDISKELAQGKSIIKISVRRGTSGPYYLADHGMEPSSVYVRVGNASVPAREEHIRRMIKEAYGDRYVTTRSLIQKLTFKRTQEEFKKANLRLDNAQKRSLGIIDENGLFTNLGLLLSEQCRHTTKIVVFEGSDRAVIKSRKEFRGGLIQQFYDIIEYIYDVANVQDETDKSDGGKQGYPAAAIREAVSNAIIHRDYELSASTFIKAYSDRLEFLTVGGLIPGITIDAVLAGESHLRNENLVNVFHRLKIVEGFGAGVTRIMDYYADHDSKPEMEITDASFRLTLPMRLDGGQYERIRRI